MKWPRIVELIVAGWLAASPFILGHVSGPWQLWVNDLVCAGLIALFAGLSFTHRLRRMYLAELAVVAWLLGFGFFAADEPLPSLQNDILVAFVLAMFAIIPSDANEPPPGWREFRGNTVEGSSAAD